MHFIINVKHVRLEFIDIGAANAKRQQNMLELIKRGRIIMFMQFYLQSTQQHCKHTAT